MKTQVQPRLQTTVACVLALSVAVAALVLAACGGSSTTASTTPMASPSVAAASPSPSWSPTMSPAPIPVVKPGQKPPPFSELKAMFAYDTSEPFDYREVPNANQTSSGITFRNFAFQSGGELASGYLALPKGDGPFPVVVTAPGQGEGADCNDVLVRRGYAVLALDEPSLAFSLADAQGAIANYVEYGIQERRALDLLKTMPEIDARRVGFMGFSNGAIAGALLAGVDDRVKAYILKGVPLLDDEEFKQDAGPGKAAWDRYVAQMAVVDLAAYVGHNKGAAFLFVNGDRDYRAMRSGKALMAVAPKPRDWYVFAGSHSGPETVAIGRKMDKYWLDWMVKQL